MLAISIICWAMAYVPMCVVLWCMHMICLACFSIIGYVLNSRGIVGFLYVILLALKWVMICEFGKGPLWGLGL